MRPFGTGAVIGAPSWSGWHEPSFPRVSFPLVGRLCWIFAQMAHSGGRSGRWTCGLSKAKVGRHVTVLHLHPERALHCLAAREVHLAQPLGLHHGDQRDVGHGDRPVALGGLMADADLRAELGGSVRPGLFTCAGSRAGGRAAPGGRGNEPEETLVCVTVRLRTASV